MTSLPGIFLKKILPSDFRVSSAAWHKSDNAKFSKPQNYCNNESFFVIFATLKCVHSVLQFELNKWKSYVIVDWYVSCEKIA